MQTSLSVLLGLAKLPCVFGTIKVKGDTLAPASKLQCAVIIFLAAPL